VSSGASNHTSGVGDETLTDVHEAGAEQSREISHPQLFVALECSRAEAGSARHSLAHIDRVVLGRGAVRGFERQFCDGVRTLSIGIPDPRMSLRHVHIFRDKADFFVEDAGSRNGMRVNGDRVIGPTLLADVDLIEAGHTILRYRASVRLPMRAAADLDSGTFDAGIALPTLDPSLARMSAMLAQVARSGAPVLVLGETGTGKEVLARAIHAISGRRGAFVAVNCAALPATLVEAQLFGHVRGAFSGAVGDAPGLLRGADGGTLLLDEIGDLAGPAQAALLRSLQEQEIVPVGGVRPIRVDLRVVAATHRPLDDLVARGAFRSDLFARIAGFTFRIPPVRERRDDIGLFVAAFAVSRSVRFTPAVGRAILRYDWPLNVRELHRVLDVGATLADGGTIELRHLPPAVAAAATLAPKSVPERTALDPLHEQLVAALVRHCGNVSEVARELGKDRRQVQRWLARFDLDARLFRRA
jgi:DNA-binding NtrC family response regulator